MFKSLAELQAAYQDKPETHRQIWDEFTKNVNATPSLKEHRDFVERGLYGYGDRPYHWMWNLLVQEMPANFKFLEIGVFQGQVISLVSMLAREQGKAAKIIGITPLNTAGDKYATHPDADYLHRIRELHIRFKLPSPSILTGYSYDPRIKKVAEEDGPYDLVYIDGCHDYEVVVDDIKSYASLVSSGGLLVIDDAATDLALPKGMIPGDFKGLEDVTRALSYIPYYFDHVAAVGHNRIYRKW